MCCSFPDFQQKDVIVTLAGQPGTEPMTLRLLIKRTNHNTAAIPPPSLFLFPLCLSISNQLSPKVFFPTCP